MKFKHGLDLNDNLTGQHHAYGTSHANAVVGSEHIGDEFAESVDDQRLIAKIRSTIDHSQGFDKAFDSVYIAKMSGYRRQHGKCDLSCGPCTIF